jgi:hypothetical protein
MNRMTNDEARELENDPHRLSQGFRILRIRLRPLSFKLMNLIPGGPLGARTWHAVEGPKFRSRRLRFESQSATDLQENSAARLLGFIQVTAESTHFTV